MQGGFDVVKVCRQVIPVIWMIGDGTEHKKLLTMKCDASGHNK